MNGIPQDGPERLRYAAQVMLAAANGEKIEAKYRNGGGFVSTLLPVFNWDERDYRVAPKARVCKAFYNLKARGNDPWTSAYPINQRVTCVEGCEQVPLIELTPEVNAALAAAGIDYEGKEAV